jgi:hypothetical protein
MLDILQTTDSTDTILYYVGDITKEERVFDIMDHQNVSKQAH